MILNEEIPQDIRAKLNEDALMQNRTLNDTASVILAERLGTKVSLSPAPYRPGAERFKLLVPETLHRKIRMEAARRQGTIRGTVLSILAEHYELEPVSSTRRPRRRTP